jgi:hypothetical protein
VVKLCGIDVGLGGALALLSGEDGVLLVEDMPVHSICC